MPPPKVATKGQVIAIAAATAAAGAAVFGTELVFSKKKLERVEDRKKPDTSKSKEAVKKSSSKTDESSTKSSKSKESAKVKTPVETEKEKDEVNTGLTSLFSSVSKIDGNKLPTSSKKSETIAFPLYQDTESKEQLNKSNSSSNEGLNKAKSTGGGFRSYLPSFLGGTSKSAEKLDKDTEQKKEETEASSGYSSYLPSFLKGKSKSVEKDVKDSKEQ